MTFWVTSKRSTVAKPTKLSYQRLNYIDQKFHLEGRQCGARNVTEGRPPPFRTTLAYIHTRRALVTDELARLSGVSSWTDASEASVSGGRLARAAMMAGTRRADWTITDRSTVQYVGAQVHRHTAHHHAAYAPCTLQYIKHFYSAYTLSYI